MLSNLILGIRMHVRNSLFRSPSLFVKLFYSSFLDRSDFEAGFREISDHISRLQVNTGRANVTGRLNVTVRAQISSGHWYTTCQPEKDVVAFLATTVSIVLSIIVDSTSINIE